MPLGNYELRVTDTVTVPGTGIDIPLNGLVKVRKVPGLPLVAVAVLEPPLETVCV